MVTRTLLLGSLLLFLFSGCSSSPGGDDAGTSLVPDAGTLPDGGEPDAGLPPESLDPVLLPLQDAAGLPALGAAAFNGERTLGLGAAGRRKVDEGALVTAADKWHLGSCTKAMTATLTAVLVEEGVLGWSTTLEEAFGADWLPDLHDGYKPVTVAQLLSHTGGAPGAVPADLWNPLWQPGDVRAQRRTFTEGLLRRAPAQSPGTFAYSNAGYMVVGALLEKRTGQTWEELMAQHLFEPLGMDGCGFGPPASPDTADQPWGHERAGAFFTPAYGDNPPAMGPAGTVHCPLDAWGAYLRTHLRGLRGEPDALGLSAEGWTTLHTPAPGGDYALGWIASTRPWAGGAVYAHTGSNTRNFAVVWLAPEINRAYVAVSNAPPDQAQGPADEVISLLVERYAP